MVHRSVPAEVFEKLLGGRPKKEMRRHILYYDTSGRTLNVIAGCEIDLLTSPVYSLDLASYAFWLLSKLKETRREKVF